MALTVVASGTLTLSSNAETNLESARAPGAAGAYVYEMDFGAAAAGEVFFMRVYTVVLASGTERLVLFGTFIGGLDDDPIQESIPVPVDTGSGITVRCSIERKNGSSRAIPWKLYTL